MSPPAGGARSLPASLGVTLRIAAPEGAQEEAESALPAVDVSAVPGARVTLRSGFRGDAITLRAACVTAPSDRWAPGVEELVLGRATGLAIAGLGVTVDRWESGPIETAGARMQQLIVGRAGDREVAAIAHTLGFVGPDHEVVLCSIGCAATSRAAGRAPCDEVIRASAIEGPLVGPPPPSTLVRTALFAAESPRQTGAILVVVAALVTALIVVTRPRSPRRAR